MTRTVASDKRGRRRAAGAKAGAAATGAPRGRPKGTGSHRVYTEVREDILALRLPPGATIDESSLEARFGVSRTPVREAMIRLAGERLITLLPNRGARVTPIDIDEFPELFEALELCQRVTIRWAALRRTDEDVAQMRRLNQAFVESAQRRDTKAMGDRNREFHEAVARACGNRYVSEQYLALLTISLRLARTAFTYAPLSGESVEDYYSEVARQHDAMIDSIETRDPEAGDLLARRHTQLFRDRVMRYVSRSRAHEVPLGPTT